MAGSPILEALALALGPSDRFRISDPHVPLCRINRTGPCRCPTELLLTSYKNDFDFLWKTEPEPTRRPLADWLHANHRAPRTIVVLDDRPSAPDPNTILVSDYVTPYDWTIVTSLLASVRPPGQVPQLRILILSPEQAAAPSQSALRRLSSVANVVPWVQTYGVLQRDEMVLAALPTKRDELSYLRTATPLRSFGIEYLLDDMKDLSRVRDLASALGDNSQPRDVLRDVIAVWRADLVSPQNRHSVANYLAPAILAASLPEKLKAPVMARLEKQSAERLAVTRLAKSLDLWPTHQTEAKCPERGVISEARQQRMPFFPETPVFLLVDDQFDLGYREILAALLFGGGKSGQLSSADDLHCLKSPTELLTQLNTVDHWNAPRVLRWNGIPLAGMFLDLRLWSRHDEQLTVLGEVVKTAERIGAAGIDDPAIQQALAAAARVLTCRTGFGDELEALILLPLLLSHYDASLPIVLFSSTQQRRVTDSLRHRHNIIATFSKPILAGYDNSGEELGLLLEAVRQALANQPARHLWNVLETFKLRKGAWNFPLAETEVRVRLAQLVWAYLIADRSYDFLSVPWEFLEACLGRRPGKKPGNWGIRRQNVGAWARGQESLVRSIETFRHRKTHGLGWLRRTSADVEAIQRAASLLAALLLDFCRDVPAGNPANTSNLEHVGQRLASHIAVAVPSLGPLTADSFLNVEWWNKRFDITEVDWSSYAACAFFVAQHASSVSPITRDACSEYIDGTIARS